MDDHPKLRRLEPVLHQQDGVDLILLRDPQHISQATLVLSPQSYQLATRFNGRRSLEQIREKAMRTLGRQVTSFQLERLLAQLDQAFFLDNSRFHDHHREVLDSFRSGPTRDAFHAGASYPLEAGPIMDRLSAFYLDEKGAGLPGVRNGGRSIRALLAPHIDLRLGGACYTHAYRALAEARPADLYIVLGTGHQGLPQMFSVCDKDFVTPLGRVETDRAFAADFRRHLGEGLFGEDLAHRYEHTIEFQLVFLQHLLQGQPFKILPVLVSFSYQEFEHPAQAQQAQRLFRLFVQALRRTVDACSKRICYIASIDLAHIGPRYGDEFRPTSDDVEHVMKKDLEMLAPALAGDAQEFFEFVREELDSRRICGFSPLYTLLSLLEGGRGHLLDHSHARMDETDSFVTFVSGVFD